MLQPLSNFCFYSVKRILQRIQFAAVIHKGCIHQFYFIGQGPNILYHLQSVRNFSVKNLQYTNYRCFSAPYLVPVSLTRPVQASITPHVHSSLFPCCTAILVQTRHKSNKRSSESEDKDEEENEVIYDDALDDNDFEAPAKFKVMNIQVASLRSDNIISHALNIARNRLDEMFLSSSLRLNGEKIKKKAGQIDEGDYIDVIVEKAENQIKVKRVKLLKVLPDKTATDKYIVRVRVWKTPFVLEETNNWKTQS